jgi:hypothetical protein
MGENIDRKHLPFQVCSSLYLFLLNNTSWGYFLKEPARKWSLPFVWLSRWGKVQSLSLLGKTQVQREEREENGFPKSQDSVWVCL